MKRLLILLCALPGCVVTTLEAQSEPPRVTPAPSQAQAERRANKVAATEESGPQSVGARHLLVAYQGALRASPGITRSKEEAKKRAEEALTRARAGEDFESLVKQYSDEPGAAGRGGDLGRFTRKQMVKPFADAAFRLNPGELSDVVETEFGFHVIQRTE